MNTEPETPLLSVLRPGIVFRPSNMPNPWKHKVRMGHVKGSGRSTKGAFGKCRSIPPVQTIRDHLSLLTRRLLVELVRTGDAMPETCVAIDALCGPGAADEFIRIYRGAE